MKLFGGKKGDEKPSTELQQDEEAGYYDSPVEKVSLSDSGPPPPPIPAAAEPVEEERPDYGIDSAIQLMRALPVDQNTELVVQVIKTTLESLKVRVSDIIMDAQRKEKDLEDRISQLKREIGDFEKEIQGRKEEISRHETDHEETTRVRGRLELAEKAQQLAKGSKRTAEGGA